MSKVKHLINKPKRRPMAGSNLKTNCSKRKINNSSGLSPKKSQDLSCKIKNSSKAKTLKKPSKAESREIASNNKQKYPNRFYLIPKKLVGTKRNKDGKIEKIFEKLPAVFKNGILYYEDGKTECNYYENLRPHEAERLRKQGIIN